MGYGTPDVYYQPEHFGLTQIADLDDPDASYSFDMLVVWRHEDGRLFYATDSGCSCPSPFEDHTSLDSLSIITKDTFDDFCADVADHCKWTANDAFAVEKVQVMSKVATLLRRHVDG